MAEIEVLTLNDALDSLGRRPGIAIGPAVTCPPGTQSDIMSYAVKKVFDSMASSLNIPSDLRAAIDFLAQAYPDKVQAVEREIKEGIRLIKPSLDLPYLAKAGWSACISLTDDVLFESALRNYADSLPTSRSITVISDPSVLPPERTIPVYKLMGDLNNSGDTHALALSESALLVRQQTWSRQLRTCPDYLKGAALLFVGTSNVIPMVRVVLSTLLAMPHPNVSRILFLKDDQTLNDPTVRALSKQCSTAIVDGSLRDLCEAISNLKPPKERRSQVQPQQGSNIEKALVPYTNLVALVPSVMPHGIDSQTHLPSLIDGLFRPSAIDWNPFLAGIDLRRNLSNTLKSTALEFLDAPLVEHSRTLVVHGEAGVGKTTLLKRVAIDLAAVGVIVLWCRRNPNGGWIRPFKELVKALVGFIKNDGKSQHRIVVFCDDPWSLRLDAGELLGCFDRFPSKIVFVLAVRNSDYYTSEISTLSIGGRPTEEHEVPFDLVDEEIALLPVMLERIGAFKNASDAKTEMAKISAYHAKDILCSLWYLIPETRSQFSESLRDEYCRLGNVGESLTLAAQDISARSTAARRAYEFVTVTSNLNIGLPIEVLVHALGMDYNEWLYMTVDGRPLWGLLYDEHDDDNQTIVYRTRNEIVTKVLLDLVNGGVGHAGEYRVLKELLNACNVGTSVYRNFILDVLVRNRSKLGKMLSYEDGLELFDIARKALLHEDRLLEHHKGIWIDDIGRDSKNAYAQLEKALQTEVYPTRDRDAPQEHIYTSMASTVVKMVKNGEQDRSTGFELVREHLRRASSPTFFNAHTAHVAANILFEMSQQNGKASTDTVGLTAISEALYEIERAFQTIGAHGRGFYRNEKSISLLTDLQRKILISIPDTDELYDFANSLFLRTGIQAGFEVVARRLLANAIENGKGSAYNEVKNYIQDRIAHIEAAGKSVAAELLAVRIDLVIRWRIQGFKEVEWGAFAQDLKYVLETPRYRDDVIKTFYYAVALFQTNNITDANAVFASLRRLQLTSGSREIRCYYLGQTGHARRLQGTLERKHGHTYIIVPELDISVPAQSPVNSLGSGVVVHVYIGFSMNGAAAVFDQPNQMDYQLS